MADCPEQVVDTTVYHPEGWRRFLLWSASVIYRLWSVTVRVEMDDKTRDLLAYHAEPILIVLWHNSLFMAPIMRRRFRKSRPVYGLVSASRDGGGLAYFFEKVGIGAIRGSSSRFGREGFNDLIRTHREGNDITVTPDGPRGPVYVMKPGAVLAARRAQTRVLLGGFRFRRCWRLKSWDRFFLPMPFSSVRVNCELLVHEVIPSGNEGVGFLQDRLRCLTGELVDTGQFPIEEVAPVQGKARSPLKG